MSKVFECDEELRKQSDGDKFFVSYANDTKIKTFKTEKEAEDFKAELDDGQRETEIEICYTTTIGDTYDEGDDVDNLVEEHINDYCREHKIDRPYVSIVIDGDRLRHKVNNLHKLQQEIFDLLAEKERWSQECCEKENKDSVKIIHEGDTDEIMEYCLECGGYIE